MQPRSRPCLFAIGLAALLFAAAGPVRAQQASKSGEVSKGEQAARPTAEQITFFEREVRPLLSARCYKCHGEAKQQGGLRLDSRSAILAGGDLGPAAAPGEPSESRLIEVIGYAGDLRMPPSGRLPDREIATLTRWVKEGMPWPAENANASAPSGTAITDGGPRPTPWSFQPIADPPAPEIADSDWARGPLDRFIAAKLSAAGLHPAPAADKRTLLRRAKFDLLGIPPTPAEIDAFLADDSPDAFARNVDRFLAMPEYGQRWGRHWLDVARYADSNGQDENLAYVNAYRYRDYVIDSFNRDKPYDQFVREQIAGDLLPESGKPEERFERLVATGFLTLGPKMLAEDDPAKMEMDIVDEQVDAIGGAFLGLTLGCARCHDHKFDPISTADYYSVAGILKSTLTMDNFKVVAKWHERPLGSTAEVNAAAEHAARLAAKAKELNERTDGAAAELIATARGRTAEYLLAATELIDAPPLTSLLQAGGGGTVNDLPSDTVQREAENFDRGNVLVDTTSYGVGIGVILNRGELPNYVEYDLQVPRAGSYQLELRYAAAEPRPVQLLIDGKLRKANAAANVTGSWNADTQRWSAEGIFDLPAGKVVLRLERTGGPIPHFDRLALVPRAIDPANPRPAQSAEDLARERNLVLPLVTHWVDFLQAARQEPQSIWQPWFAYVRSGKASADQFTGVAAVVAQRVLGDQPADAAELAARYQAAIEAADKRGRERASTSEPAIPADPADEALRKVFSDKDGPFRKTNQLDEHFSKDDRDAIAQLKGESAELERTAPPALPQAMAVEEGKGTDLRIHIRGSHLTLGDVSPRGFPRALAGASPPLAGDASGRLELATWMTSPSHPLTSRVLVNRLWRWHFGAGLVRSTDNFGNLGDMPSHPELLDWLATRLIESGWSIKAMHRLIMLSATYQMSATYNAAAVEADPDNRLLWRANRRRLEAEAVRDALLFVGGGLDTSLGGTMLKSKPREYVTGTASTNGTSYVTNRRSVYLPVVRSALYDAFQAFDFAEPTTIKGDRDSTTIASQALFMMNSDVINEQSGRLAARLIEAHPEDRGARVQALYQIALGRASTVAETVRALAFVDRYAQAAPEPASQQAIWQSLCRVLLSSNEFLYVE